MLFEAIYKRFFDKWEPDANITLPLPFKNYKIPVNSKVSRWWFHLVYWKHSKSARIYFRITKSYCDWCENSIWVMTWSPQKLFINMVNWWTTWIFFIQTTNPLIIIRNTPKRIMFGNLHVRFSKWQKTQRIKLCVRF